MEAFGRLCVACCVTGLLCLFVMLAQRILWSLFCVVASQIYRIRRGWAAAPRHNPSGPPLILLPELLPIVAEFAAAVEWRPFAECEKTLCWDPKHTQLPNMSQLITVLRQHNDDPWDGVWNWSPVWTRTECILQLLVHRGVEITEGELLELLYRLEADGMIKSRLMKPF